MKQSSSGLHRHISAVVVIGLLLISSCNRTFNATGKIKSDKIDSLSFIVVGDWGKRGKQAQKRVAAAMAGYAKKHPVQFIISTGDNFYYTGVQSTSDPQWKYSFENIYTQPGLQVPWYPVLGNHDHGKNPEAQIEYTRLSKRWTMPAFYFALKKKVTEGTNALLLFTDTSPLISDYYPSGLPNLYKRDTAAQTAWLTQQLNKADEQWKVVIGHHPVYSAGKHGDTKDLIARMKPILKKAKVDFYISGHDHSLQHLKVQDEDITYLVSGAGSERTGVTAHRHARFTRSVPGFLVMTLYSEKAKFAFYNSLGILVYRQEIKKNSYAANIFGQGKQAKDPQ